jgi:polysaccharide deacetylase 2 family uncharacterized protein YibQ
MPEDKKKRTTRSKPKKKNSAKRTTKKRKTKQPKSYIGLIMIIVLLALITVMIIRNCTEREPAVEELTVEESIRHAAEQLGVPDNLYRRTVRDDGVYINITLNPDILDLVFPNMIIQGQVEAAGGEVVTGHEVSGGAAHLLRIHDPQTETDFIIRLQLDRQSRYPSRAPMLAIIVDDFGEYAGPLLDEYLDSDPSITFSILPDLRYSRTVMEKAVEMGREIMLHIPMEPVGYPRNNPGSNPILVEHSDREINRIINGYLRQLPDVVGANNHMGSLATADERVMSSVLGALARHDLFFVDSRTTQHTIAVDVAQRMQLPVVQRDLFLDDPESSERIMRERLQELKRLKEQKDRVVVITHCFDRQRLEIMNKFVEEAKNMGFRIVPVSEIFATDLPEIL